MPRKLLDRTVRQRVSSSFATGAWFGAGVVFVASTPTAYAKNVFLLSCAAILLIGLLRVLGRVSEATGASSWAEKQWNAVPERLQTALILAGFLAFLLWLVTG